MMKSQHSKLVPGDGAWDSRNIIDFLSTLDRTDLLLSADQSAALVQYIHAHAKRGAIVLDVLGPFIPQGARIFSIGSMPNQIELLIAHEFDAIVVGSTYSPRDRRDKFTASYRSKDGWGRDIEVFIRDFTIDPLPQESSSCDVVLAFEVFEHLLESPLSILREAYRILKPGGHILISTPNSQHWHRLLYALHGMTYPDLDFQEPVESRHTHIFSLSEMRALLIRAGFHPVEEHLADPWSNSENFHRFEMDSSPNNEMMGIISDRPEFAHECMFVAATRRHGFLGLTQGWYSIERSDENWTCWTDGVGEIEVNCDDGGRATIEVDLYSIQRPNVVTLMVNGDRQELVNVDWDGFSRKTIGVVFAKGKNTIRLVSERPGLSLPTDTRILAVAVRNLTITVAGDSVLSLAPN